MTSFALIGAAGYIAPRHMRAIRDIGGDLKVAFDPRDSVGIIDSYFPDARFFVEFERFDRHVDKLRRAGEKIDYVSICSPNYLHDAHCRFACARMPTSSARSRWCSIRGTSTACAKSRARPGARIYDRAAAAPASGDPALSRAGSTLQTAADHEVVLTYITSRGRWYHVSWKGDEGKSGGSRHQHRHPLLRHADPCVRRGRQPSRARA